MSLRKGACDRIPKLVWRCKSRRTRAHFRFVSPRRNQTSWRSHKSRTAPSVLIRTVFAAMDRNPQYTEALISLSFFFLAMPHGLWDLSSPTRDRTRAPSSEAPSPNHWTAREIPDFYLKSGLTVQGRKHAPHHEEPKPLCVVASPCVASTSESKSWAAGWRRGQRKSKGTHMLFPKKGLRKLLYISTTYV